MKFLFRSVATLAAALVVTAVHFGLYQSYYIQPRLQALKLVADSMECRLPRAGFYSVPYGQAFFQLCSGPQGEYRYIWLYVSYENDLPPVNSGICATWTRDEGGFFGWLIFRSVCDNTDYVHIGLPYWATLNT